MPIRSFKSITSTFAAKSPHVGIYNVAYDIWTNGIATNGSTEFMIWTENFHQTPTGSRVTKATFGGRDYNVWKTDNNRYIAFVPTTPFHVGQRGSPCDLAMGHGTGLARSEVHAWAD